MYPDEENWILVYDRRRSTIVKDIPSHSLAYGNPAKIKKEGINFEF